MNIIDLLVVIVIAVYLIRGIIKGLVLSIFHVASFFVAAYGAAKLYPSVSLKFSQTSIYMNIRQSITQMLTDRVQQAVATSNTNLTSGMGQAPTTDTVQSVMETLPVPDSMKLTLIENLSLENIIDIQGIVDTLSQNISTIILNILSIIIVFFAIKLVLFIIANILDQVMSLPVLNGINKIAGGIFGGMSGLIMVYIIFAIFTLFAPTQFAAPLIKQINESMVASVLYNNNILLNLIL